MPWWPALVFGWPGPILAIVFSVIGLVRGRVAWLIAATIVIVPFSFYLALKPRVQWGVMLPLLPLVAAWATSRGFKAMAWLLVLLLSAIVLWLAGIVVGDRARVAGLIVLQG